MALGLYVADQIVLTLVLVLASASDIRTRTVPNKLPLAAFVFHCVCLASSIFLTSTTWTAWLEQFVAPLAQGAAMLFALVLFNTVCTRAAKSSVGGADIKLLALIATYVSFDQLVIVLLGSSVFGIATALVYAVKSRKTAASGTFLKQTFPWVPAISLAYVLSVLIGRMSS